MTEFLILALLLLLSGVFSGSETALVALSLSRVEGLLKEGRRGARALYTLKHDPTRMLITILIGNNLVNIAASAMATVIATRWFGSFGPGIAVGILTIVILIFGEITPKSLATRYSERISLSIAPLILGFMRLIYPLVWLFSRFCTWVHRCTGMTKDPTVTELELISLAEHGEKEGTIEPVERELIERIFDFNDLMVKDVMTHRGQIFSLEGNLSVAEALPEIMRRSYTRIPLYDKQPDDIRKVLYLRDVLATAVEGHSNTRLNDIARDPIFVHEEQAIDELFTTLSQRRRHLAVVVDEYGALQGIVALEDLLEELVGEIYDETDETPQGIEAHSEDKISVNGTAEVRVVEQFFDVDLSGKPTDTVNRWILNHTDRIPAMNETFIIEGLQVTVEKASRRSIVQVVLNRPQSLEIRGKGTSQSLH